jgi:hypothetical protein
MIETIHRIGARAERKVERELLNDIKHVTGKHNLFELADATLAQPDGVVREVIFPVVGEETLRDLVKEWKATGPTYRTTLRTVIRNSYQGYYRRMVPKLLAALEFRSNDERHYPVMQALELVKRFADTKVRTFPADEEVPLDGVVRGLWRDAVVEVEKDAASRDRINRVTYEVAVLETLREQLRCKEIWVVGANRYRNPDEDLPADFEANRDQYYEALDLPLDADRFISQLQDEMREALGTLNGGLKKNADVRIGPKGGGWITARSAQPEDVQGRTQCDLADDQSTRHGQGNRSSAEFHQRAKKSDRLRNDGALSAAATPIAVPARDRDQCRAATHAEPGVRHDGQGFVLCPAPLYQRRGAPAGNCDRCRRHAAGPKSCHWGSGTTACASDSKHYGAWDQNLTTQRHARYGRRAIMIYSHVERNSLCIHSQLKSPSSSEVASMIEGVIHHCTEMEVERQYVDSHRQSTIAFAFCRLLGFLLLPRLKAIHSQKLSRPETGKADAYANLQLILSKPIDWDLVHQQYDQMIKYATALRLGRLKRKPFCDASPSRTCSTPPTRPLPNSARPLRRSSSVSICIRNRCDARSTTA